MARVSLATCSPHHDLASGPHGPGHLRRHDGVCGGFRHLVRHARPESEWLGTLTFGAAAVWLAVTLVADGLMGGATLDTLRGDADASAVRALVMGVTMVATCPSTRRPSRCPESALPFGSIEAQSPPFEPRFEDAVLFSQERDDLVLLMSKPTEQRRNQEVKRKHVRSMSATLDAVLGQTPSRDFVVSTHTMWRSTPICHQFPSGPLNKRTSAASRRALIEKLCRFVDEATNVAIKSR
jgi:hypothetical protein